MWDVFVSYRWVDPDQSWVRDELVPKLRTAGLQVLLDVAEDGFVPGRDAICEMTRAGRESRHTLSIWTPDYFADDRAVWFEALQARRRDPQGRNSALVPLLLRQAVVPGEFYGLIPIDWTSPKRRMTEWRRLLGTLGAPQLNCKSPSDCPVIADASAPSVPVNPDAARGAILESLSAPLTTQDPVERYWRYIAIGLTGGADALILLRNADITEVDSFARLGIQDAIELLSNDLSG